MHKNELIKQNKMMRDALLFYAHSDTYYYKHGTIKESDLEEVRPWKVIDVDEGTIARITLEKMGIKPKDGTLSH